MVIMVMAMAKMIVRCDDLGLLGRCKRIPARQATKEEVVLIIEDIVGDIMINVPQLLICHSAELLEALEKTTDMTEEQLKQVELMDTLYDLWAKVILLFKE